MNVHTPKELKDGMEALGFEEIDSYEHDKIMSNKDYIYGEVLRIQFADPLDTCTHYNYAYFKRKCVKVVGDEQ